MSMRSWTIRTRIATTPITNTTTTSIGMVASRMCIRICMNRSGTRISTTLISTTVTRTNSQGELGQRPTSNVGNVAWAAAQGQFLVLMATRTN